MSINSLAQESQAERLAGFVRQHYLALFSVFYGLFVGLPFLAPVLMHLGLELPGRAIYTLYSFLCHQLPERSFFLFGSRPSYPVADIAAAWPADNNFLIWRQFTGSPAMGWKVAWSDRMVSMYTSVLFFAWLWGLLRRQVRPLHLSGFLLLLLPMVIDGATHMVSDNHGLYSGFRYNNAWLAGLTHNAMPALFYLGDEIGSFNSWMRLITGALFGLGVAWFCFPILERYFTAQALLIEARKNLKVRLHHKIISG